MIYLLQQHYPPFTSLLLTGSMFCHMSPAAEPGARFDHYEIRSFIGEGGMAAVYLAHDLRHDRPVAIKLMNRSLATAIANQRFRREIEIAARLTHPHVVPLYDSGITDDQPYYVMPYVSGESLRRRLIREKSFPVEEAVRLASQVASALQYAHQQGLVHRDIKPENILLSDGIALVSDFGIARLTSGDNVPALTMEGTTVGTPAYMSPEQVQATAELDGRADLYSLGCVLFEMLAGRPPFLGAPYSLIQQHLSTPPCSITEFRAHVPNNISRAIEKALAKQPVDRFGSAAEFIKAITSESTSVETIALKRKSGAIPSNLPKERTRFIGRDEELQECLNLLQTTRLLTLTGLGGGGKTRLAIKVGEHFCRDGPPRPPLAPSHTPSFPDGVYFVDLSPLTEESRVVDTVAQTLGVRQDADRDLTDGLLTWLSKRKILLLLDNCEHLIAACATLVDQLLNLESDSRVVVTSREALGVSGEKVFSLRPLTIPVGETSPKVVASSDAVLLFVDRAQLARSDFQINDQNALDVAEICRRLDGIPLAIELAAARVRVLSVSQIRQKLDDRFRLLTSEGRTALPRHQTMQAAIRWSYEQLLPAEQRLLRLLSVFAGGCTLDSVAALCWQGLDDFEIVNLLTHLIDKSLVVAGQDHDGPRRYTMLDTVRAFAFERLMEAHEADALHKQHLHTFLQVAERAYTERINKEQEWAKALESEIDNFRTALEYARNNDEEKYLDLVGALAWFWQVHSHLREGREHLTAALSKGADGHEIRDPQMAIRNRSGSAARARALCGAAHMLRLQGDPVTAQSWMHEAIAIWRRLGDEREIAFALEGIGYAQFLACEDEPAKATFEECLRLQEAGGDPIAINRAKVGLAQVLVALSEVETARPMAVEIIRFSETHNDKTSEHFGWHFLADCALIEGKCTESLELYKRSLLVAQELGDQIETSFEVQGVAMSLAGLGLAKSPIDVFEATKGVLLAEAAKAEWDRVGADIHIRFWDALLDRYIGAARKALLEPTLADTINRGRSLSFDAAVTLALEVSPVETT
jgi:non-specific serine/threonine protein kinase